MQKTHSEKTDPFATDQAADCVLQLFNQRHDPRRVFHTYQHAMATVERLAVIARAEGIGGSAMGACQLAAWFRHTGRLFDPEDWETHSHRQLQRFMAGWDYPPEFQGAATACLYVAVGARPPADAAQRSLSDAVQIVDYIEDFEEKSALRRLEWELLDRRRYDKLGWARLQLQELLNIRLHTGYARIHYDAELARRILSCKESVEKAERKTRTPPPPSEAYGRLEEGAPMRGAQTFFRSNYRNHINLSAIADNKANILISVNTILISVLITFLSYRNIGETQPAVLLPVVLFLVTGLASLIFAVLSARPKVTSHHQEGQPAEEKRKNIVFFGNFVHLDLEEYEAAMEEMLQDKALLYGNLTRDLYHLGKVLDKKYRYLSLAYNIFMVGFIATVITFLILFFT